MADRCWIFNCISACGSNWNHMCIGKESWRPANTPTKWLLYVWMDFSRYCVGALLVALICEWPYFLLLLLYIILISNFPTRAFWFLILSSSFALKYYCMLETFGLQLCCVLDRRNVVCISVAKNNDVTHTLAWQVRKFSCLIQVNCFLQVYNFDKHFMLLFLWNQGRLEFIWLGGAEALGLTLHMAFLCLITFWELFFEGFDGEPWPGIIISWLNGISPCFFGGKSCSCVIICNRILCGWQSEYTRDGFVGKWELNQQCIGVDFWHIYSGECSTIHLLGGTHWAMPFPRWLFWLFFHHKC